jgi:chromate reductase, NAD(P)H dehydrogenase (quinone)
MSERIKIVGFGGSLRKESYSRALLNAAKQLVPSDVDFEIAEIYDIPLFNQDISDPLPAAVKKFKDKIKSADAILIATPEYNHSIPGYLKNVIDWGTRPSGDNSFDDKTVAVISSSPGGFGGVRAQLQFKPLFISLNMHPVNKPEVIISAVNDKFDANGILTDQQTKDKIAELLKALVALTRRLEPS